MAGERVASIVRTLQLIAQQIQPFTVPSVTKIAEKRDPYQVLISCILSLRTKDKTTVAAAQRLFQAADTPGKITALSYGRIQRLIYPVGFYRVKAKRIAEMSRKIISDFAGKVPDTKEGLLSLKGVGPKTANLVLGLGYHIPAICVDTHVHRISNRLGWVRTKTPQQTEEALQKIIPLRYWIELNTIFVAFGQNICVPVSPYCSKCYVSPVRSLQSKAAKPAREGSRLCHKAGVDKFR